MAIYTAAQLTELRNAFASGELSFQLGDKKVTYRSLDELEKAIQTVAADVEGGSTTAQPTRFVQVTTSKGV